MKDFLLKGFVTSGWAGVFFIAGTIVALEVVKYQIAFAKMEQVIRELDQRRAYVCESKGTRMECQSWVLKDPGV